MDRKYFLIIGGLALLAIAVAILSPGGRQVDENPRLPWLISVDDTGALTVFELTLEQSTLADARRVFKEDGKINLFVSPEEEYTVEAYFERLFLSGLKADIVIKLTLDEATVKGMYDRGERVSKMGSGDKKVSLAADDSASLADARIENIAFIPAADLNEKLLVGRFGEPTEKIAEESGITHWLYPDKGLDIAVNPEGKEVFQYVSPGRFNELAEPLRDALKQSTEVKEAS